MYPPKIGVAGLKEEIRKCLSGQIRILEKYQAGCLDKKSEFIQDNKPSDNFKIGE
jgi:hypothetical protein